MYESRFYCCDTTPWLGIFHRKHLGVAVAYSSRWLRFILTRAGSLEADSTPGSGTVAENSHTGEAEKTTGNQCVAFKTPKPVLSNILPPARPHLLNLPK